MILDMFSPKVRRDNQVDLNNFGDGLAGRGSDLNRALAEVQPLVDNLLPVMNNLLNPGTQWSRLFPSLEQAAHEVVGVAQQQADLFTRIGQTFTPLSQHPASLQAAITGGPPSLRTATQQLPQQSRFVSDTAALFHRFRPAFRNLASASAQLAPAEAAGIPVLRRTPALNQRLTATFEALQRFADDQRTLPGLALLTETARLIEPTVAFIEPAQTKCNYLTLFFRNLENALSESDQVGTMLGVTALALPQLPNSEAGPSSAPADGPPASGSPIQRSTEVDSYLHSDPYPYTASPGQPAECEAGNEQYVSGRQMIGTAPLSHIGTEKTKRVLP